MFNSFILKNTTLSVEELCILPSASGLSFHVLVEDLSWQCFQAISVDVSLFCTEISIGMSSRPLLLMLTGKLHPLSSPAGSAGCVIPAQCPHLSQLEPAEWLCPFILKGYLNPLIEDEDLLIK